MISVQLLWESVLLRGVHYRYAKNSHFKNFESAPYLTSVSMPLSLSHFENGCYVTAYLMLGRSETWVLLSAHSKICVRLQKDRVEALACCREVVWWHISIFEVGLSLVGCCALFFLIDKSDQSSHDSVWSAINRDASHTQKMVWVPTLGIFVMLTYMYLLWLKLSENSSIGNWIQLNSNWYQMNTSLISSRSTPVTVAKWGVGMHTIRCVYKL